MSLLGHLSGIHNPAVMRAVSTWRLGSGLLELEALTPDELQSCAASISEDCREEWRAAIAREILLLDRRRAAVLAGAIGWDARPFKESDITLKELLNPDVQIAAALAPLLVKGETDGKIVQIWLVRGLANPPRTDAGFLPEGDAARWLEEKGVGMFLESGEAAQQIAGKSWQLAAALVCKALDAAEEVRTKLARDWVVTGRVEHRDGRDAVEHVEMGNKITLARETLKRRWLLPRSVDAGLQVDDPFVRETAGMRHSAGDVETAWAQVSGRSIVPGEAVEWQGEPLRNVKVVHTFASDALTPRLMSYLLLRPQRIVIWRTKSMGSRADQLRLACETLKEDGMLPENAVVEVRPCSEKAARVEVELREHETLKPGYTEPVIFNITGGTNLMRFAPAEIARTMPGLFLLYRSETKGDSASERQSLAFTLLHYPASQMAEASVLLPEALSPAEARAWLALVSERPDQMRGKEVARMVELSRDVQIASTVSVEPMNRWLFSFAAKNLQAYVMAGGKLRDMVGATSLIDKLSSERWLAERLISDLGCGQDEFRITQAAAGAAKIVFTSEAAARRVAHAWPLLCHAWAPGLTVVTDLRGMRDFAVAAHEASAALEVARNFPNVRLPEAGPFVKRSARTGEAAVGQTDREDFDQAERRKRAERGELRGTVPEIAKLFGFTREQEIPKDFEELAGEGSREYLGVFHADGNRLGEMFLNVGGALRMAAVSSDDSERLLRELSSTVIAKGTIAAVQAAVKLLRAEKPDAFEQCPWPLSPVVLAGDDLTAAFRADLALTFARHYLAAFNAEMASRLESLRSRDWFLRLPDLVKAAVPHSISACGGLVFCQSHYPFYLAYELCEDLTRATKGEAKKLAPNGTPPTAIGLVRIVGASAPTEYSDVVRAILTASDGSLLTAGPYLIGDGVLPRLDDLLSAEKAARKLPKSTLRGLLKLQRTDIERLPETVARMMEVANDQDSDATAAFERDWKKLSGRGSADRTWRMLRCAGHPAGASPLADMLAVRLAEYKKGDAA